MRVADPHYLIDALAGNASQAIKVAGATLGLIADLSGAIGGIISGSEFILQQLGVVQTDTEQLLNEIDRVYTALAAEARGQDIINRVNFIALVLGPSQAVVQNLQLLINASPPLTQVQAIEQIELCLTALNVLQNADWALPSGDPIYWTDSGVYLLDPPFGDVGYGEISPTPDQNDLVFNYTYFLPGLSERTTYVCNSSGGSRPQLRRQLCRHAKYARPTAIGRNGAFWRSLNNTRRYHSPRSRPFPSGTSQRAVYIKGISV